MNSSVLEINYFCSLMNMLLFIKRLSPNGLESSKKEENQTYKDYKKGS